MSFPIEKDKPAKCGKNIVKKFGRLMFKSRKKSKSIATSVPTIKYHASDDELEELYPSSEDEKLTEAAKLSPQKNAKQENVDHKEGSFSKERSCSMDGIASENTTSDTWSKISQFKGKISKTIEDKLTEMKKERRRRKLRYKTKSRSRDTSSMSDSEEMESATPTDDSVFDKPNKSSISMLSKKSNSSTPFETFSGIKVGLKTEMEQVESGIEAAEDAASLKTASENIASSKPKVPSNLNLLKEEKTPKPPEINLLSQLMSNIFYQLATLIIVLWCTTLIPLHEYFVGLCAGIFLAVTISKMVKKIGHFLTASPYTPSTLAPLKIPAVEEHVAVQCYEGWVNELPYNYDPENYHVARTKSVLLKLEGQILHVMETRTRIPKRAIWDEPRINARFTKKRIYNISQAIVELLPNRLIRRRRWSKKYPICITMDKDSFVETVTLTNSSDDEDQQNTETDNSRVIVEEEETDDDLSQSKDAKDVFCDCVEEENTEIKLFIFARTDRQKEDWFRRLVLSSSPDNSPSSAKDQVLVNPSAPAEGKNHSPSSSSMEIPMELSYVPYMIRLIENQVKDPGGKPESEAPPNLGDNVWVNALLSRILFDMHKCPDFINVIQDKIQRKLSNIKLPYFMESLSVSEVVIGQGAPKIQKSSKPTLDERGLWFDLEILYEGCMTMTIETKLNLMKLKKGSSASNTLDEGLDPEKFKPARSAMFDSDVEDSPETSTEDDDSLQVSPNHASRESTPTQSSGRKFLNIVDKLAANKYFQHATELSYIRRAMEGVSNTEIRLVVSVSSIEGSLAINIPPAPSDRFWYGFRPVPRITLTAKPAVGERALNIVYVTKWIETKLLREFEKVVVIPNMDDLVIPLCTNYPYES